MTREPHFDSSTKLAHDLRLGALMLSGEQTATHRDDGIAFAATEDAAEATKGIRGKPGTTDRESNCQSSENGPNGTLIIGLGEKESTCRWRTVEIKFGTFCIEQESLDSDSKVFVPEVFGINTAAPGMVSLKVAIA